MKHQTNKIAKHLLLLGALLNFGCGYTGGQIKINTTLVSASSVTGIVGLFAGALGLTTASSGTCAASGVNSAWCSGGTFSLGAADGAFNNPSDVAIDSTGGYMYVLQTTNHRIDKLNLTTGAFIGSVGDVASSTGTCSAGAATTWCTGGTFTHGTGNGMFNYPTGLAIDTTNDYMYIADSSNYRIVKARLSTGAFIGAIGYLTASSGTCASSGIAAGWCTGGTFTGTGYDGTYNSAQGVAIDVTGNALYVADYGHSRVDKITLSTGAFIGSIGQTVSSSGTCPSSGVTTGWCTGGGFTSGSGDGAFNGANYLALDTTNGFLYVTDWINNRVEKFNLSTGVFVGALGYTYGTTGTCPSTGATNSWCTGGLFELISGDGAVKEPGGIALDVSGNILYVASNDGKISKFVLSTGVYVGGIGDSNASSGTCPSSGAATSWCVGGSNINGTGDGMFHFAQGIRVDTTHNYLYITDYGNNRIVRVK